MSDLVEDRLDQVIEHLILFMTIPSWDVGKIRLFPHYPPTPQFFSGAEPFLPISGSGEEHDKDYIGESLFHQGVNVEDHVIFLDATTDALDGRINISTIGIDGDGGDWKQGYFAATRLRGLPAQEVRGKTRKPMREYLEASRVWFNGEKTAMVQRNLFGTNGRGIWEMVEQGFAIDREYDAQWSLLIQALIGVQFGQRYHWSVELGYAGLPQIRIPTDPVGAREVFRLRDLPEGASRRTALRHWVRSHWRRRSEGGDPVLVRDFLRGQTAFTWNGLRCSLRPSRFDLERDEAFKALSSAARKDARSRLKRGAR